MSADPTVKLALRVPRDGRADTTLSISAENMTADEWDNLMGLLAALRPGMVRGVAPDA